MNVLSSYHSRLIGNSSKDYEQKHVKQTKKTLHFNADLVLFATRKEDEQNQVSPRTFISLTSFCIFRVMPFEYPLSRAVFFTAS